MKKVSTAVTKQGRNISQQKLTMGLDLADRNSWYCVVNEAGQIQLEQRVRTNEKALREIFGAMPRSRIALEIGTHSPWISRLLSELGHEVIVANARKVRLIGESRKKDDRLDAETLARLARIDPELLYPVKHRSERPGTSRSHDDSGASGLGACAHCSGQHGSRENALCRRLRQIPGFGPLVSTATVAAIGNGAAFRRGRDFAAWVGIVPRQYSTGGKQKLFGISKRGNIYLRRMLIHGARAVLLRVKYDTGGFGQWVHRLAQRAPRNKVIVAIATSWPALPGRCCPAAKTINTSRCR
jgi:transposase